jgi:hypothetical protein
VQVAAEATLLDRFLAGPLGADVAARARPLDTDRMPLEVQVEAEPTPDLTLMFIADYHRNRDDCCAPVVGTPPVINATGREGGTDDGKDGDEGEGEVMLPTIKP